MIKQNLLKKKRKFRDSYSSNQTSIEPSKYAGNSNASKFSFNCQCYEENFEKPLKRWEKEGFYDGVDWFKTNAVSTIDYEHSDNLSNKCYKDTKYDNLIKVLNETTLKISESIKRREMLGIDKEEHIIDESMFILGNSCSTTNDEHRDKNDRIETSILQKHDVYESNRDSDFNTNKDSIIELDQDECQ